MFTGPLNEGGKNQAAFGFTGKILRLKYKTC